MPLVPFNVVGPTMQELEMILAYRTESAKLAMSMDNDYGSCAQKQDPLQ
jgi:hypothetical protein